MSEGDVVLELLVIETHAAVAADIKKNLELHEFMVDVVNTGAKGKQKMLENHYDAVLLDLSQKDCDGLDILRSLRKSGMETPVLLLTEKDAVNEVVLGLDFGADACVPKPFHFSELCSVIMRVVDWHQHVPNQELSVGPMTISILTRNVRINGTSVLLTARQFDVLLLLAAMYPEAVPVSEISERLYHEIKNIASSVIRVHVARLRKKLFVPCGTNVIQNKRGKGYILVFPACLNDEVGCTQDNF